MKKIPKARMRLELKGSQLPRVIITLEALQKIRAYTAACPVEINGRGYVERVGNDFLIADVFIMRQRASGSRVDTYDEALHGLIFQMAKAGMSTENLKFQWHSHAHQDVFFSVEDLDTIEIQKADYHISMVVNKRGESLCRLDLYRPFRAAFMVNVDVLLPYPDESIIAKCWNDVEELVDLPFFSQRLPKAFDRILGVKPEEPIVDDLVLTGENLIHQNEHREE
jgi:hypothetical protein